MYTPASEISSFNREPSPPLSLENIKKINPDFKVNSPDKCSHIAGGTPQEFANRLVGQNSYCVAYFEHRRRVRHLLELSTSVLAF